MGIPAPRTLRVQPWPSQTSASYKRAFVAMLVIISNDELTCGSGAQWSWHQSAAPRWAYIPATFHPLPSKPEPRNQLRQVGRFTMSKVAAEELSLGAIVGEGQPRVSPKV